MLACMAEAADIVSLLLERSVRKAAKKFFLVARPIGGWGGGGKGLALKKKDLFFKL